MQSYIVKCISLCCAVVVSVCAHAQSVEELCKEHVDHLGGKMAVEKVKTIKIQQVTPSKISPTSVYAYYETRKGLFPKKAVTRVDIDYLRHIERCVEPQFLSCV